MSRTYFNQFDLEKCPCSIPTFILENWADMSWGNEVCPHFDNSDLQLTLWVDFDNPEDREWDTGYKYTVTDYLDGDRYATEVTKTIFETNSEDELKQFLTTWPIKLAYTDALNKLNELLSLLRDLPESEERNHQISLIEGSIDDTTEAGCILN